MDEAVRDDGSWWESDRNVQRWAVTQFLNVQQHNRASAFMEKVSTVLHQHFILFNGSSYTPLWTISKARAAMPMFFRTSVLVCEFSRASLWNSMVDSVPSIWVSCCSSRFFLFRACRAADTKRLMIFSLWSRTFRVGHSCTAACLFLVWGGSASSDELSHSKTQLLHRDLKC